MDLHRRRRSRIVGGVVPAAAGQRVGTGPADQSVIARAAVQHVGVAIADQRVVVGRSDQARDARIAVPLRIAGVDRLVGQAGGDPAARGAVRGIVEPAATDQRVGPGATDQRVVAAAAVQHVGIAVTVEQIVEVCTDQVLYAGIAVTRGIARILGRIDQAGSQAAGGIGIAGRVGSGPADQDVGTGPADQRIVARPAIQRVGTGSAGQHVIARTTAEIDGVAREVGDRVVEGRADHGLERGHDIAVGIAANAGNPACDRGIVVDRDPCAAGRVVQRVDPAAAIKRIGPGAAVDRVVAQAAIEVFGARAAGQRVVVRRSDHAFDRDEGIARGIAAGDHQRSAGKAGVDCRRPGIGNHIGSGTAIKDIGARPALQRVVAIAALKRIVARAANQAVVVGAADQHFDVLDHIAGGGAARTRGHPVEIGGNPRGGGRIVDRIGSRAAIEQLCAQPADQRVVAGAAMQRIGGARTDQAVVVGRSVDHLDRQKLIAGCRSADAGCTIQVHGDPGGRIAVVGGVDARAAVQRVGAQPALQRVVAGPAIEVVGRAAADDHVGIGRSDDVLDVEVDIALGIAARSGSGVQVDGDRRGRIGVVDGVGAGAAIERIGPGVAADRVVAGIAIDVVGIGIAPQHVIAGGAVEVVDPRQHVARRIAARADRAVEPHGDCR